MSKSIAEMADEIMAGDLTDPSPPAAFGGAVGGGGVLAGGFRRLLARGQVAWGAMVYLGGGGVNQGLVESFGYTILSYVGKFWPGRQLGQGARKLGPFVPPPRDPGAFRREVERARSEDPRLKYLP